MYVWLTVEQLRTFYYLQVIVSFYHNFSFFQVSPATVNKTDSLPNHILTVYVNQSRSQISC